MKKYSHIFFDLDHTLWDTDRNAEESLEEIYHELKLQDKGIGAFEDFHERYRSHNERLWGLYAENKVGKEAVRVHRFLHTLQEFDVHDHEVAHSIADRFLERTPFKKHLIEGALNLLEQLQGDFHLSIITNGFKDAQYTKMKVSGLDKYFKNIFISEEVGVHKPDPKIFHHAMKASGAGSAETCMMIGDSFQTDVFGALQSGITPVHFNPGKQTVSEAPVITIRKLSEIRDHI